MGNNSNDFNTMTDPTAYGIYVLVQTGNNSFEPVKINLSPNHANSFNSMMSNFEDSLDPQKVIDAAKTMSDVDPSALNPNAAYYTQPAVTEAVLHLYNDALGTAVNAYNDLAAEHGDKHGVILDEIGDLTTDNHRMIDDYVGLGMATDSLLTLANNLPPADADDAYQDKVDGLIAAQENLEHFKGFAQETYLINQEISSPAVSQTPLDWSQFEFDGVDSHNNDLATKP